jgi:hypothetical protein
MATLADIYEGLRDYFEDSLTANRVKLSYDDERVDNTRTFPEVTIGLIDARHDPLRRYGGILKTRQDNPDGETTVLTRTPIPINLQFQLDAYSEKRRDDWTLTEELMRILCSHQTIVTSPLGEKLILVPLTMDAIDVLTEPGLWRKAYRFYVPTWLDHPAQPETEYLVLVRHLNMNDDLWIMPEAA